MTIETFTDRLMDLSPSPGSTELAYEFPLTTATAIKVIRHREGASTLLNLGTDYYFPVGLGNDDGGSLTLSAPTLKNDRYILVGLHPEVRLSDFNASKAFSSDKFNGDLDLLTILAQEHRRDIDRAWKSEYGAEGRTVAVLPEGHFHKSDADGNLIDGGEASDIEHAQENAEAAIEANEEAQEARIAAESAAGANLANADSVEAAKLINMPGPVNYIRVAGYSAAGEGGAGLYRRVASQPDHRGWFRSADGAYWEYAAPDSEKIATSLIDRLLEATPMSDMFMRMTPEGYWAFSRTCKSTLAVNSKIISELYLRPDADGLLRIRGIYDAPMGPGNWLDRARALNMSLGDFVGTDGTGNWYATTAGATFELDFYGTGFAFTALHNNQGGLWRFIIGEGTPFEQTMDHSVYAEPSSQPTVTIFSGLPFGRWKVKAVFQGDDPANVPSGGAGTGRGWLKYHSSDATVTTAAIFGARVSPTASGLGNELASAGTVQEFALNVSPSGSGLANTWVPDHGPGGACRNIERSIFVDGELMPDLFRLNLRRTPVGKEVKFVQKYTAFNGIDVNGDFPLWNGVLIHTFKKDRVTVDHEIRLLRDIDIAQGYMNMLSVQKPFVTWLIMDDNQIFNTATPPDGSTNRDILGMASGGAFVAGGSSGRFFGINVRSPVDALRRQTVGPGPTRMFITERADGNSKLYFGSFRNETLRSGERYHSVADYVWGAGATVSQVM